MTGDIPPRPGRLTRIVLAALAFGLASAVSTSAIAGDCADPLFSVKATDPDLAERVCELAPRIRQRLEACGLVQTDPIAIEISPRVDHPFGTCLAYFDCDYDLVRITEPGFYGALVADDPVYSSLPDSVILRSLLTHELTHALIAQSAEPRRVDIVDQEYLAAAMELELMASEWRAVYLAKAELDLDRPPSEGLIDVWIYGFTPRLFAVNAWRHFTLPENGCDLAGRLVSGKASFTKPVRPELR